MILPPATLGMLGGGQLGRLFTIAARMMGYHVIVLDPDLNSPAGQLADQHIKADYNDKEALITFAKQCAVITTEFENIPAESLTILNQITLVYPSSKAIEITQHRIVEKDFIHSCGLLTASYHAINSQHDINTLDAQFTFPAILKTARFGYDGKGQITVNQRSELKAAYHELNQVACILEQRINLDYEISVIIGRNTQGETGTFPVAENIHRDGILYQSIVPARSKSTIINAAQVAAKRIIEQLDYVGIMGVEFFISKKGELLVNEIAPRTHNSGHYTVDACITSQFEQQVRMICGLPFASTTLLSPIVMVNLLGDLWKNNTVKWEVLLSNPNAQLHLYGKKEARIGRKMGHYCVLGKTIDQAINEATYIAEKIGI